MPSDKLKMQATNASNGKCRTHNFGKARGDNKTLTVKNQEVKGNKTLQNAGFIPKLAY